MRGFSRFINHINPWIFYFLEDALFGLKVENKIQQKHYLWSKHGGDNISRFDDFLHCKISTHSFSYLGIIAGVSQRRQSTWNTLIDRIKSKISLWQRSQISFGGRGGVRPSNSKKLARVPDLKCVSHKGSVHTNGFWTSIIRHIGNRSSTRFWHDTWSGQANFYSRYKMLFNLSSQPNGLISDFGAWVGGKWKWSLSWKRRLFTSESELIDTFLQELNQTLIQVNNSDSWEWKFDKY
ncbi:hypothetical protein Lal_00037644 [Lupinus albus]|nr:hypothetical protein Lal_00037644 [Lupinus albus]